MNLTDVADEVIKEIAEDMSLQEHDMRYHDNNYRGGKCLYREQMGKADHSDAALEEANRKESILWGGRRFENKKIIETINKTFPFLIKKGNGVYSKSLVQILEPDANGNSRLVVFCGKDTEDSKMPENKLVRLFGRLGYDCSGYTIMEEKADESKKRQIDKKLFMIDFKRKGGEEATFAQEKNDTVTHIKGDDDGEELNEEKKNEMMKRYGIKRIGGKVVNRDEEDARKDRIRKYLGILNDFGSGEFKSDLR